MQTDDPPPTLAPPPFPAPQPQQAQRAQLAARLGQQLKRYQSFVNAYMRHEMLEDMDDLNMSFRQVGLMFQLRERGVQNVSTLAEAVRLTLPATSHLIERLVQRGLLERGENPENRREKQVALTPQGEAFLSRMEDSTSRAYAQLLLHAPLEVLEELDGCFAALNPHLPASPGQFICTPGPRPNIPPRPAPVHPTPALLPAGPTPTNPDPTNPDSTDPAEDQP